MKNRDLLSVGPLIFLLSCTAGEVADSDAHGEEQSWPVTAWGEHFEIFAEMNPLILGETSMAHTHVTILEDFSPIEDGSVTAILRGDDGSEQRFPQPQILRSGIYNVEITPNRVGELLLLFRVETPSASEEIASALVSIGEGSSSLVGSDQSVVAAAADSGAQATSFLKEQQWKTSFSTAWISEGSVQQSIRAPARIRPRAGGEVLLTAPVPGIVQGDSWPYLGMEAVRGTPLFQMIPWVDADQSMADLEAEVEVLSSELLKARRRRSRLADLSELGATSKREIDEAETQVVAINARLQAATLDLEMAKAGRLGKPVGGSQLSVQAPFASQVAEVYVTPGEAVPAGARLARLISPQPVWIEVAIRSESVKDVDASTGLIIETHRSAPIERFEGDHVRLVSVSPSVDSNTGKVTAIFEVTTDTHRLRIGSRVEAEILLPSSDSGIVVPITALVDDGGVTVVYLQVDGESFARRQVRVLHRQGDMAQIAGLETGGRLVTVGGSAIRRAALVATDVGEGHVH